MFKCEINLIRKHICRCNILTLKRRKQIEYYKKPESTNGKAKVAGSRKTHRTMTQDVCICYKRIHSVSFSIFISCVKDVKEKVEQPAATVAAA